MELKKDLDPKKHQLNQQKITNPQNKHNNPHKHMTDWLHNPRLIEFGYTVLARDHDSQSFSDGQTNDEDD